MHDLQLKKHAMTGISYLIPYVCAAGMLMVIGNICGGHTITDYRGRFSIPDALTTLGGDGLGLLPVFISTFIAYSIADRPGIAPGFLLGLLCKANGFGFLGGLLSGYLGGFVVNWLKKVIKVPSFAEGIVPQMILPLLTTIIVGLFMEYIVGVPIIALTDGINTLLISLQGGSSIIILGLILGTLSAIDYGGPINKVVFVFVLGFMTEGIGAPIATLISASMIAPFGLTIGYFLSRILKRDLYSQQEVDALKSAFLMGCCQITEGSYPIILNDLVRITICTGVGAAVDGALTMYWDCSSTVPAGGFFALPGISHPGLWLLSLLIGSCVFAVLIQLLKRKPSEEIEIDDTEEDLDLSSIKISG
ncbi:PTS system fructose-specific IIC component [Sporomusaceae bacterium BoRhaA]|uniref:PTS fructose transporter subunit IIC n=1 Tax=Pelorhabdus rhamnosifermentans TaxID=2772457 RepID=UPI001C0613D4|nr:PTS fructose transporter subunit IIC [Pelorhabdus rhamnosifermentans]MBU2701258.1 PTS system fructose-specific IIC component [Pelorhabdus rhamnosifermentans]